MKSRVKNSPAPPEMKTLIYEQPGKVGEITAKKMMDIILAYSEAYPEFREEYMKVQQEEGEYHA